MGLNTLTRKQELPISLDQAWDFFSSPANLKIITPPYMGFEITSNFRGEKMYAGQLITYIVRPILSLPMNWVTEITHVNEPHFFVDEQRFGPYAFWHHKHFFEPIQGGVLMEDTVHYKVPMGILGQVANVFFVRAKLESIFDYRFKKLEEIFGKIQHAA